MKLIVTRSQHWGGFWNTTRYFCLDILGVFTDAELAAIRRYGLGPGHLYTSAQWLEKRDAILPVERVVLGQCTTDELVTSAISSLTLGKAHHITVGDLIDGTHVHATDVDELDAVFRVIVDSAKALDRTLARVVTFESPDGQPFEELVDLSSTRS